MIKEAESGISKFEQQPSIMNDQINRRKFITAVTTASAATLMIKNNTSGFSPLRPPVNYDWQIGIGRRVITPNTAVWLAGYSTQRVAYGKIHDLYAKVLALKSADGRQVVMATTDNQGMSKTVYEQIFQKVHRRYGVERADFMLTFSHNHSGPCLEDDLVDYYPSDEHQRKLVHEYSEWMGDQVVEAVGEALENPQPAQLFHGKSTCTFAVNRRDNSEEEVPAMIAAGKSLKGAIDHDVPVLAIKSKSGNLLAVLFGYACHPTTLSITTWSGDYPGFAQRNLEASLAGTAALFFNACGGDQNPLPRRTVALCEKYGSMLSDAVLEALSQPLKPVSSSLGSAFQYVDLAYEEVATRDKLQRVVREGGELQARWARRMLAKLDAGDHFAHSWPYPVQTWMLGNELLFIAIGGEAVVDYSIRFKKEFRQQTTWVCGYANEMAAYIPSRRVWEEGGYEGGPHIDEYGHPAWRWAGDVENRIADTVQKLVKKVRK